jgi:hypothetical protein
MGINIIKYTVPRIPKMRKDGKLKINRTVPDISNGGSVGNDTLYGYGGKDTLSGYGGQIGGIEYFYKKNSMTSIERGIDRRTFIS